jgi:internalin A
MGMEKSFLLEVDRRIEEDQQRIKSLEITQSREGSSTDTDYLVRRHDADLAIWQRVKNTITSRSQILDLSNLSTSFIPKEIFENLDILELNLNNNDLFDLPAEIGKQKNLKKLYLNGNMLRALPEEIGNLEMLEVLCLDGNHLSELPKSIASLKNLQHLDLYGNKITELQPEIFELLNLRKLYVGNNKIHILPASIGKLENLEELLLSNTKIAELPIEIKQLSKLRKLNIHATLIQIPPEIRDKTNVAAKLLPFYFEQRKKRLNEAKLVVVGESSVGKSSIIRRLVFGDFNLGQNKTEGVEVNKWIIKIPDEEKNSEDQFTVNIWDFGGQEIYHPTHKFFMTKRNLYLLVLNARNSSEQNRVEYWLKTILAYGGNSPIIIIGNQCDQHQLDIDEIGLKKKYPNICGFFEVSAKENIGFNKLVPEIKKQVVLIPNVRDPLPESWFRIKKLLEDLRGSQNLIGYEKYIELCVKNGIQDENEQRDRIQFLHELGVILYFQDDPRLEAFGILNPEWVTTGVFKIMSYCSLHQTNGVFSNQSLDEIFNSPEYPHGKRSILINMMRKFQLCFDIEQGNKILIPDLLPQREPYTGEWDDALAFEYHYSVLPANVISRFIVRMSAFKFKDTYWRNGVVLKKDRNTSLIRADLEDRKICIFVSGEKTTRRDMLSAIRGELDAIHNEYMNIDPKGKVPVPGYPDTEPVDYDLLLLLESQHKSEYFVKSGTDLITIKVHDLLNGVESETDRQTRDFNIRSRDEDTNPREIITGADSKLSHQSQVPVQKNRVNSAKELLGSIAKAIFVSFPSIIGHFILDLVGREKPKESTVLILGYLVLIALLLILWKVIDINYLSVKFLEIWRALYPVK